MRSTASARLNVAQAAGLGASLHTYDYQLTASGHRHQVIEGTKTTTYDYDDLYRLTGETITGAPSGQNGTVGYNLDKVGNRLDRTSSLSAVPSAANQTYNARDQLSTDTYDTNGNTKNSGLLAVHYPLLTTTSVPDVYDFEDRLIVRTRPDGATINLSYDADGVRIQKTILDLSGQLVSSTRYLVDTRNLTGYAQAAETTAARAGSTYEGLLADAQAAYPGKAGVTELHHVTPKYMGGAADGPLAPLDAAYHQQITNEFRSLWPYGGPKPSPQQLQEIMQKVYQKYPLPATPVTVGPGG